MGVSRREGLWSEGAIEREGRAIDALLNGTIRVLDVQRCDSICSVSFVQERAPSTPLSDFERKVLKSLIRGKRQKEIAFELGVAITTVNGRLRGALQKLGLRSSEQSVLVATALDRDDAPRRPAGTWQVTPSVTRLRLRVDLLSRLSAAECEVALRIVDGWSNAAISTVLQKSPRTVSNQTASAFRKLGVGSRLDLVRHLVSTTAS